MCEYSTLSLTSIGFLTHSPCQNFAALSASSAFCASVLRLPKTPREVGVRVETTARGVDGANAKVEEAKKQMAAIMAMIFFMVWCGFMVYLC